MVDEFSISHMVFEPAMERLAAALPGVKISITQIKGTVDMAEQIFWGDTHHNTYQASIQDPPLDGILKQAGTWLDFYAAAYYTPIFCPARPLPDIQPPDDTPDGGHPGDKIPKVESYTGVGLEHIKDDAVLKAEWAEIQAITQAANEAGRFVTFPGYEWQGDGKWGDHNVFYPNEGAPLFNVSTLPELYQCLRNCDAIAIPHHTGYCPGHRSPHWQNCDDALSPFAEIFSVHGSSETDEEWIGLRHNSHMGPGVGGSTYQDALNHGLHLGAIGSTDNWTNMPGHFGHGLMACLAPELTREALWQAFRKRRVYGVSGDRIELDFSCNGEPMGSILDHADRRELHVDVAGMAAIDRIELLRNGRVIATNCHQGNWRQPADDETTTYRFRVETGWGPRLTELPLPYVRWQGTLTLSDGRFTGWSPAWVTRAQTVPRLDGPRASIGMTSYQHYVDKPCQGASILECRGTPETILTLELNGETLVTSLGELAARSQLICYRKHCEELIQRTTGVAPETVDRDDVYYNIAIKAKLHRAVPEAGFRASFDFVDHGPLTTETHYRVRVEQRNGQRAWSSPIWVAPRH